MVSPFQSLCARPPTPPKHAVDEADNSRNNVHEADEVLDFIKDPFVTKDIRSNLLSAPNVPLSTPQSSPASSVAIPSSSASRQKRVLFEPKPSAIPTSGFAQQTSTPLHSSPLRSLPQTRLSKPLKSILKPIDPASTPPPADQSTPAHKFRSFADMLESITKQLASPTRSSRLDAYNALLRTMQAYDKVPDIPALVDKMGLLTQFIRRDMQAQGINGSGLDSQLIGQALKLLMALLRISELRPAMEDDFCTFVVERILQVASEKEMPKTIVNTHLATLMQQSFRPKVMTVARVEKILDLLDTIHDRVSGQSVLAYRIRIYKKLLQQKPDVMAKHTEKWFKHLVHSLLSTQKDINQGALELTLTAARTLDADRQFTKSVLAVLNQRKKDGESIARIMARELTKMLNTDHAALVPQIWSVITALLKGCMNPKDFPALNQWLRLFQDCCNSVSSPKNVPFGVLVYAVNLDENSEPSWDRMLLVVPEAQLVNSRRSQTKSPEREAAASAYCMLLYYSLNPQGTHEQLDRYWKNFVVNFWTPSKGTIAPMHAVAACRVVSALFDGSRKPWDPQRALDLRPHAMMSRGELPLLDPRWVRKSLASILPFVETLLDATPWTAGEGKEEPAKTMWLSLLQSLNAASSQEVKASAESKDAMARIINALRRMWNTHAAQLALSQQKEDNWANKFCYLVESSVQKLGTFAFTDKCLAQNQKDEMEVTSTPSRSRQPGPKISPMLYFVDLLVNQSEGRLADPVRLRALELVVNPCFDSQKTRVTKLEMLRDCCTVITSSSDAVVSAVFWTQIGTLTKSCLRDQTLGAAADNSRQLGKEYELVVQILSLGSSFFLKQTLGQELLTSFIELVRSEAGEAAIVLAVIEKVSESVLNTVTEAQKRNGLPFLSILLRNLPKTIKRRTIEQSRQQLWPSSSKPGRNLDFDPYHHLYTSITSIGSVGYHQLSVYDVQENKDFLRSLALSVQSCPIELLAVYLQKIQQPIRLWVEDADRRLQVEEQGLRVMHPEVVNLWKEICAALEKLPKTDSQTLRHLDVLVTAGFVSRRRGIASISVSMWNNTFGKQDALEYPTQLEQALQKLRNTFTLSLPSLEADISDTNGVATFYDSDGHNNTPMRRYKSPRVKESPFRIIKSARKSRSPAVPSTNSRRTSTRATPKSRLRHDDSQIEFQPIARPPALENQESQVLTDRQREMSDRQEETSNLYATMGINSSPVQPKVSGAAHDQLEIHSDASVASDLPVRNARTPVKRLQPAGPMDVFVGSSPTPHVRNRTRTVDAGDTSGMSTPTNARIHELNEASILGSSPPRVEKGVAIDSISEKPDHTDNHHAAEKYAQVDGNPSMSFDEGTTIDEAIEDVAWQSSQQEKTVDMPSSTIDLQLIAQFDADMEFHDANDKTPTEAEAIPPAGSPDSKTAPKSPPFEEMDTTYDTEADENISVGGQAKGQDHEADVSSTSLVEDSFSSLAPDAENSQVRITRSSARHSAASSPAQPTSSSKRPRGRPRKSKPEPISTDGSLQISPAPGTPEVQVLDNIVVASPVTGKSSRRRTRLSFPGGSQNDLSVPETTRKRGVRRSASALSQVETPTAAAGEGTPTPKRARASINQDVSEAKRTPSSQTKRLSHVRVTPRSHSSANKGKAEDAGLEVARQMSDDTRLDVRVSEVTQDAQSGSQSQGQSHTPAQSQVSAPAETATPNRSFADRVILTPRSIINQLKNFKDALLRSSQLVLGRREEREIDDTLFEIRREIYAAGRRSEEDGRQ